MTKVVECGSRSIADSGWACLLGVLALIVPGAAMAACSSATPAPVQQDWVPATFTVNKAKITIYTAPTDLGAQLQLTSGIDKALWVTEVSNSAIMKFSTKGHATIYATPTPNAAPEAIAMNAKKMWFTEWTTSCAGSVAKTGKVSEYSTGLSENMSTGMASGPANTAWFVTDYSGIGKIDAHGRVTIYGFANQNSQPLAITQGPDGNMWFEEGVGNNVGKITPQGTVTEYNAGFGNGSGSFGIAAGSDGRIWFADAAHSRIGAINTDGSGLTYYSAGLSGQPYSIASGSDGNLYFGETAAVVGRITIAGVITEYPFTASKGTFPVISITSGPDKNIWFSNNAHSQVGMLKLPIK